jgi:hypothetical protein
MSTSATKVHPAQVIGAWCEGLLAGRRVALLGDGASPVARQVARASGRRVQIFDPSRERVAACVARQEHGSAPPIAYAPFDEAADAGRADYDVVLVPDLGAFADKGRAVTTAHALLRDGGTLVLVAANVPSPPSTPGAGAARRSGAQGELGYYELYDLVAASFPVVRMLGQAPFVGFTVAEFGAEGDPAVTIDTSLCPTSEEPAAFVVVASSQRLRVEPYTLVEVPVADAVPWLAPARPRAEPADAARLAEMSVRVSVLESEIEQLRERERRAATLASERQETTTRHATRAAELERELGHAHRRVAELDKETQRLRARAAELERHAAEQRGAAAEARRADEERHQEEMDRLLERIGELEASLEEAEETVRRHPPEAAPSQPKRDANGGDGEASRRYEFQIAELRRALAQARSESDALREQGGRAAALDRELQELRRRQLEAERRAAELADDEPLAEHAREVAGLEARLRERAKRVESLEAQVREQLRTGRELVEELERLRAASVAAAMPATPDAASAHGTRDAGPAAPSADVDGLARQCARYEADLEAARWRIDALTAELGAHDEPPPLEQKLEEALRAAHAELAELRRRLGVGAADS